MSLTVGLSAKITALHVTLLIYSICCDCVVRDAAPIGNNPPHKHMEEGTNTQNKQILIWSWVTFALTVAQNGAKYHEDWPLYKILTSTPWLFCSLAHSLPQSLIYEIGDSSLFKIKCNKFSLSTVGHTHSLFCPHTKHSFECSQTYFMSTIFKLISCLH